MSFFTRGVVRPNEGMGEEEKTKPRLNIGHVLFLDIVGYSKLLIDEQSEALHQLNRIVRAVQAVRAAEANGCLILLPTGDGMALVFTDSLESPVEAALQISWALRDHPALGVRMGVHSGPIQHLSDVTDRANIAGAGINIAQRVMDCGDAGHIIVSRHVAEDLESYGHWKPLLHDLGECEVKHGTRVHVFNLYKSGTDDFGNSELPQKFRDKQLGATGAGQSRISGRPVVWIATAVIIIFAVGALLVGRDHWARRSNAQTTQSGPSGPSLPIPTKTIAVLPFEYLGDDKDNAYFADGIQEEILTRLAKIADLKVISRTSTQKYKSTPDNLREIGRQLGVANLLEGSVQKIADTVHINVQLIQAATTTSLGRDFDRKLMTSLRSKAKSPSAIAEQLNAKLTAAEQNAIATSRPTTLRPMTPICAGCRSSIAPVIPHIRKQPPLMPPRCGWTQSLPSPGRGWPQFKAISISTA